MNQRDDEPAQREGGRVNLRRATAADQRAIVKIIRQAEINPTDLKWQNFVVAVDDEAGAIVATGQVKTHGDGSRELASIATVPAYQRRGIAHQVIEHLMAGHSGRLYLTCLDTMGSFYEQFGFRIAGETELTPYFRRLMTMAKTFMFLNRDGRKLLVMIHN